VSWTGRLSPLATLRRATRRPGVVPRRGPVGRGAALELADVARGCGVCPEQVMLWELGYQAPSLAHVEMLAGLYRLPLHQVAAAAVETCRAADHSVLAGSLRPEVRADDLRRLRALEALAATAPAAAPPAPRPPAPRPRALRARAVAPLAPELAGVLAALRVSA
jgi:transcriptional regulator with XRE-family HTH domain